MEKMKPGRELDALIAEIVMGLIVKPGWDGEKQVPVTYPSYSTDIAAAYEIVNRLRGNIREMNWSFDEVNVRLTMGNGAVIESGPAVSIEHGICLAALRAVGHE